MRMDDYVFITGFWNKDFPSIKGFLEAVGITLQPENHFQLWQTFNICRLEAFDPNWVLEFNNLEQYRAFGPDWELWLRNINARELRFRFIALKTFLKHDYLNTLKEQGFKLDDQLVIQAIALEGAEYPL